MANKVDIKVGDLVVFNHELDATIFRVKAVNGFILSIVEHSLEHLNVKEQFIDKSLAKPLNRGQISGLHREERLAEG